MLFIRKKHIDVTENHGLTFIILLLLLNYGFIWTRGGYADDFVFLAYTQTKDLYSAIFQWSFNSRYTQAILLPLLIKISSGELPGEFYWWIFHGISLSCLAVSMLFLNSILKLLDAPWVMRFTTCLFFILYPIKNTTLMWPATIAGYVIALTLFSLGTYVYFSKAKTDSETFLSLSSVWLLFLLTIFSIEQLFPLVILMVLLRLYLWRITFLRTFTHFFLALSLPTLFISINFLGKTEKISRYSLHEKSILENAVQVSIKSFIKLIESPARLLLDPYYRSGILTASSQITFFISFLILIVLGWYFTKIERTNIFTSKKAIIFMVCGLIIWIAALSPLMVINYYMPDRVLFIPLIGLSITVGAISFLLDQYKHFFRYIFFFVLVTCGSSFSLVNIYTQNEFANKWQNEKALLEKLKAMGSTLKENTTITLFNFPSDYGPSPNLNDDFTFNGMVNWLYPKQNYLGETLGNFEEIFLLPSIASNNNHPDTLYPSSKSHTVLLWTGKTDEIISLDSLLLSNNSTTNTLAGQQNDSSRNIIRGSLISLNTETKGKEYTIKTPYLITFGAYDLGLLKIVLEYSTPPTRHRLSIHVEYTNGEKIPYDKTVSYSSKSWSNQNSQLSTILFINNISEVQTVTIFSKKNNRDNKLLIPLL